VWLDEDELDAARKAGLLTSADLEIVHRERATVDASLGTAWPPPLARDLDLDQVRRRLGSRPH
jgi:predicted RNA-binding protein associated with RNAse of E/G family